MLVCFLYFCFLLFSFKNIVSLHRYFLRLALLGKSEFKPTAFNNSSLSKTSAKHPPHPPPLRSDLFLHNQTTWSTLHWLKYSSYTCKKFACMIFTSCESIFSCCFLPRAYAKFSSFFVAESPPSLSSHLFQASVIGESLRMVLHRWKILRTHENILTPTCLDKFDQYFRYTSSDEWCFTSSGDLITTNGEIDSLRFKLKKTERLLDS